LIATVFEVPPAGCGATVHQPSTNLSTDFCGYHKINYTRSFEYYFASGIGAVQKLAAAQEFA
jgi:hypothetical protein